MATSSFFFGGGGGGEGDKDNIVLMENPEIPQNKAAKVILDRSLHSSATGALKT